MNNLNEMLDVVFSESNDELNWSNNTTNPVQTISGKLLLKGEDSSSEFRRNLGNLDSQNDRIRVKCNLTITRPSSSIDSVFCTIFSVYQGAFLIGEYSIYAENIEKDDVFVYSFDRVYKYNSLNGDVFLKIKFIQGFQNELKLENLNVVNFQFSEDKIRTYFVVDSLLNDSKNSKSSAFQLISIKIDDIETLTDSYFNDNSNVGSMPISDWKFAKADLDGSNRVSENTNPNTFNPFVSLGLDFENTDSFFGGKPISVTNGNDYGNGIMSLGFEKPEILNGMLIPKKGAFFIDIDYSKNFKMIFNVIINNFSENVFDAPSVYNEYTIEWDSNKCEKKFNYKNTFNSVIVDKNEDGFLSGITPFVIKETEIVSSSNLQITEGACNSFLFNATWVDVFVQTSDANTYVPQNGDILYTDSSLSSVFIGTLGVLYRLRLPGSPQLQSILGYVFSVSEQGEIQNISACSSPPQGDGSIVSRQTQNTPCFTKWEVTVNVPQGEQRKVVISSNFAPSGTFAAGFDKQETINSTKTYILGIDGARGSTNEQRSLIEIVSRDGQDAFVDSNRLERYHINQNC